nr:flavoprotein [Kineosporia babensis]
MIICGVSNADESYEFVKSAKADGWDLCAVTTPMGSRFVDSTHLFDLTGHPVRSHYKHPDDPDVLPMADAIVVAPASFNTINKIAQGISDTLAVGIVCEAIGADKPVIVAPWMNRALASHGAYRRSLAHLREDGVTLVLTDRTVADGGSESAPVRFPWKQVSDELRKITP